MKRRTLAEAMNIYKDLAILGIINGLSYAYCRLVICAFILEILIVLYLFQLT